MMRWWLGMLALVIGCAGSNNAIKENYKSSLERWPSGEISRLVPPSGAVEIVTSNDIEADAIRMMENGYLLLGRSKFRGTELDADAARDAAKSLGASVVFVKSEYAKTVREAVPIERWTTARAPAGNRDALGGGDPMHGEYKVRFVQRKVDYFDLSATFWAKSKPPIFGVIVENSGGVTTQSSGARGVVVRAVIAGSPAARAGLQREDVIVRFAGGEITTADGFFDSVIANKGRTVEVEIVRVSQGKDFKIELQLANE
jgi:hypothetical protein